MSDWKVRIIRKLLIDLSTRTPSDCTMLGKRGVARASRFCTSTWARSGLVPGSKVTVNSPLPVAEADDDMYIRPSAPLISRSISCSTESVRVCAVAPG